MISGRGWVRGITGVLEMGVVKRALYWSRGTIDSEGKDEEEEYIV